MPPNSYLVNMRKANKKDMKPNDKRMLGLSITGFVQGSSRAYDSYGCNVFQSFCGNTTQIGGQMGDFRGTINAMGLFLGNDPSGNSIWDTNITTVGTIYGVPYSGATGCTGCVGGTGCAGLTGCGADPATIQKITKNIFIDQEDTRLLTYNSINNTQLPSCLKDIALILSGNIDANNGSENSYCPPNGTSPKDQSALLFWSTPNGSSGSATGPSCGTTGPSGDFNCVTTPSIFSADELSQDTTYFGAFSLPLEYRKYGLRFELALELSDYLGLTIQTGVANIQQTTTGLIPMTSGVPARSSSTTNTTFSPTNLYSELAFNTTATMPDTTAQTYFNDYVANNSAQIFDSECGLNINTCNFDAFSMEDLRGILSFKRTYDIDRFTANDADEYNWSDMLFTPYAWVGGSIPLAEKQNYRKLLSLPFGNNGHPTVGGAVGLMFDFVDSIEVGFEGGGTYFFQKKQYRPVPNHPLQRVVYPYSTDVLVHPGTNFHFKANMNAYQFMNHVSFWATYEIIQHQKDCYQLCNKNTNTITKTLTNTQVRIPIAGDITCTETATVSLGTITEQIFYPEMLRCNSDWRMQFLNMGLVFDIQPGMQASVVWQQPISPKNAYYPVSIMGTFSFIF